MLLIGTLEIICSIVFLVGLVWLLVNLLKRKSKKKPILSIVLSFVLLMVLIELSEVFFHEEMEQYRIETELREAEDESKKIKELEEKNKQLEKENKKLEKENKNLEKENKKLEKDKESETVAQTKSEEETELVGTKRNEKESLKNSEEPVEIQSENKILDDLKNALGDTTGSAAYDILVNQIGFTNVEYIENTEETGNYIMTSSECDFVLTAFPDDKVYRVFQPNGGAVFFEDDTLKMTAEEMRNNAIDYSEMSAYYIMAKEIVESGLKNPRSAKFPSIVTKSQEIAMSKNGETIAVQSYVDAENSFGAMIRSEWIVQFEVIDISTYSYDPLYVNIDGETLYGKWVDME